MIVRHYAPADREALIKLWTSTFGYGGAHNDPAESLEMKLAIDDYIFVAAEQDHILGSVMVGFDGHRGWIYSLCVVPGQRKQGIGTALMDTALQELTGAGCRKVNLQVRGNNAAVVDFYTKLGFSVEDRISMGLVLPLDGAAGRPPPAALASPQ